VNENVIKLTEAEAVSLTEAEAASVATGNHDVQNQAGGNQATTPAPRAPNRREIGRMRRQYLTITRATVDACGHKFNHEKQPTDNCPDCWYAYFKTSVNMDELHQQLSIPKFGPLVLTREYGAKFVKMFRRFLTRELAALHEAPLQEGGPDVIPEETGKTEGTQDSN